MQCQLMAVNGLLARVKNKEFKNLSNKTMVTVEDNSYQCNMLFNSENESES